MERFGEPFMIGEGDAFIDELLGCLIFLCPGPLEGAGDLERDLFLWVGMPLDLSGRMVRWGYSDSFTRVTSDAKLGVRAYDGVKESPSTSSSLLSKTNQHVLGAGRSHGNIPLLTALCSGQRYGGKWGWAE